MSQLTTDKTPIEFKALTPKVLALYNQLEIQAQDTVFYVTVEPTNVSNFSDFTLRDSFKVSELDLAFLGPATDTWVYRFSKSVETFRIVEPRVFRLVTDIGGLASISLLYVPQTRSMQGLDLNDDPTLYSAQNAFQIQIENNLSDLESFLMPFDLGKSTQFNLLGPSTTVNLTGLSVRAQKELRMNVAQILVKLGLLDGLSDDIYENQELLVQKFQDLQTFLREQDLPFWASLARELGAPVR